MPRNRGRTLTIQGLDEGTFQMLKHILVEAQIAYDDGYDSVHFRELSQKQYSDITQTPFREVVLRFYKRGPIVFQEVEDGKDKFE